MLTSMQATAQLPAVPKSSNCVGSTITSGTICNVVTADNNNNYLCDQLVCQGSTWTPSVGRCILTTDEIHYTVDFLFSGIPDGKTADDLRSAFRVSLGTPSGGELRLQNLSTSPNAQLVLSTSATGNDQARLEVVSTGISVNKMEQRIQTLYSQFASAAGGFLSLGAVSSGPTLTYNEQATRGATNPPSQSTQSPQVAQKDDEFDWLPLILGILGGLLLLLILVYLVWRLRRKKNIEEHNKGMGSDEIPLTDACYPSGMTAKDDPGFSRWGSGSPDMLSESQSKKYYISAAPDVIVSPTASPAAAPSPLASSPSWRRRRRDPPMGGTDVSMTQVNDPMLHL